MLPLSVFTELPRTKVFSETRLAASSVLGNPYRRAKGNSNSSQRDAEEHRINSTMNNPVEPLTALSTSRTHPVPCNPTCTEVHLGC